jgi:hypothetical protein
MYEEPKLIVVGKAADVILGIFALGTDMDGSSFDVAFEIADESKVPDLTRD